MLHDPTFIPVAALERESLSSAGRNASELPAGRQSQAAEKAAGRAAVAA